MESLALGPLVQLLRQTTWLNTLAPLVATLLAGRWYVRGRQPALGLFALSFLLELLVTVGGSIWQLISFAQLRVIQSNITMGDTTARMQHLNATGVAGLFVGEALYLLSFLLLMLGVWQAARR